jgi:hypothetical protein
VETPRKRRSHRGPSATTIASDGDVGLSIDAELRELHQRWCALHRWLRMTLLARSGHTSDIPDFDLVAAFSLGVRKVRAPTCS